MNSPPSVQKNPPGDVLPERLYDSWHSAEHIAAPTPFSPHLPSPQPQKWQFADFPVTVDVITRVAIAAADSVSGSIFLS
ncbi:MAG: hypothetical protein RIG27_15295 [Coleofasciculus sp. F4-SAH-05]